MVFRRPMIEALEEFVIMLDYKSTRIGSMNSQVSGILAFAASTVVQRSKVHPTGNKPHVRRCSGHNYCKGL